MSFRSKTIIGIALIEVILLSILVGGTLDYLRDSNQAQFLERTRSAAMLFAANNKDAVIATDIAAIESNVLEMMRLPGMIYARVLDSEGRVLAEAGDAEALAQVFVADKNFEEVNDQVFDSYQPIEVAGIGYGRVEIGMDIDALKTVQGEAMVYSLSLASLELLLVALFSFALGTYLTRQFKELRDGAKKIAGGNYGVLIPVRGRDELSRTADTFNRMSCQLRLDKDRSDSILRSAIDCIVSLDRRGNIVEFEPSVAFGHNRNEFLGNPITKILNGGDAEAEVSTMIKDYFMDGRLPDNYRRIEFGAIKANGDPCTIEASVSSNNINQRNLMTWYLRDVSERKEAEETIRFQAFYDSLTGLPNRRTLYERIEQSLARCRRHHHIASVLFIDIDNFKTINDSLGHQVGDELLKKIASRFKSLTHAEDTLARLGGDEFVVLYSELTDNREQAGEFAEQGATRLQRALSPAFHIQGYELHVSCSIGISVFPCGQEDVNDILKHADTAMYRAKDAGKNTIRFFEPGMQVVAEERLSLHLDLRNAIKHGEFYLCYQPQLDAQRNLIGAEALIRWNNPKRGLVSPIDFIPSAEESGLIIEIGEWVIRTALAQLKKWSTPSTSKSFAGISVNVSHRQFTDKNFVAMVKKALEQSEVEPHRLTLELTESVMIDNPDETIHKMKTLREIGVHFSLDDFGTGYSSLSLLRNLPVSELKIDKSFVRDITTDTSCAKLAETICMMADNLGLEVIAEGVEREEQFTLLGRYGCQHFQGYYFGHPQNAEVFEKEFLNL
jgi:diguanylate cyclase (GGDEF)-like protein/PAS domain S-box-containing protein